MSVIKGERHTSDLEFLRGARELEAYTIRQCANFPKRYTFYVSQPLANSAVNVYVNVKKGNSVFPTNAHEAQLRRDFFINAYCELQSMVSQIELANEIFSISDEKLISWMDLIDREMKLLKGIMKSDKSRYKDLA